MPAAQVSVFRERGDLMRRSALLPQTGFGSVILNPGPLGDKCFACSPESVTESMNAELTHPRGMAHQCGIGFKHTKVLPKDYLVLTAQDNFYGS